MRLLFVRHAEPDYEHNTITAKGFCEADLLAKRSRHWNVTKVYSSPLGRALDTAAPSLSCWEGLLGKEIATPIICDWLQEFSYPTDPNLHPYKKGIAWDLSPEYLRDHPELFHPTDWRTNEIVRSGNIDQIYDEVIHHFDELLASYGYEWDNGCYRSDPNHIPSDAYMKHDGHSSEDMLHNTADYTDDTLVFFCHLGVMMVLMSHLMNTSPFVLWHGFFTPPCSITVFTAEERIPGHAYFRCQVCGDTSHLRDANEPVSYYGGFASPFQG